MKKGEIPAIRGLNSYNVFGNIHFTWLFLC